MGRPLTLASASHLQTLHPNLTWEGRLCLGPGSRKVPSLGCPIIGPWGRVGRPPKMVPGGPGGWVQAGQAGASSSLRLQSLDRTQLVCGPVELPKGVGSFSVPPPLLLPV